MSGGPSREPNKAPKSPPASKRALESREDYLIGNKRPNLGELRVEKELVQEEAGFADTEDKTLKKPSPKTESVITKRSKPTDDDDNGSTDEEGQKVPAAKLSKTSHLGGITEKELEEIDKGHHTFPERLMELLQEKVAKEAMWWLPGGDAFTIAPRDFPEIVLNKYFQGTKFESFTRKLNRWGFKRVAGQRVPPNTIAYHHVMFQKDQPELVKNMRSGKKKDPETGGIYYPSQLDLEAQAAGLRQQSSMAAAGMGFLDSPGRGRGAGRGRLDMLRSESDIIQQQLLGEQNPMHDFDFRAAAAMFPQQQRSSTEYALHRRAQMMALEQARLNQMREEIIASEMRNRLLRESTLSGYGSPGLGTPPNISDYLRQQQAMSQLQLSLPGSPQGRSGLTDPRLLQLMLLEEQQRRQREEQQRRGSY